MGECPGQHSVVLQAKSVTCCLLHCLSRSLVLADPWNPPVSIPTQFLQHLTYLSFLAEGLLVTHLASQFCEALVQLKQLEELQLSRLQLSAPAAQMMAQSLTELPKLNKLGLSGGATPMHMAELYVLLNGEVAGGVVHLQWPYQHTSPRVSLKDGICLSVKLACCRMD